MLIVLHKLESRLFRTFSHSYHHLYKANYYFLDVEQNLGINNDGRVFTLYSYLANEEDELSFECGEELNVIRREDAAEKEWWWAVNKDGQTGYIPRNLLGVSMLNKYHRHLIPKWQPIN